MFTMEPVPRGANVSAAAALRSVSWTEFRDTSFNSLSCEFCRVVPGSDIPASLMRTPISASSRILVSTFRTSVSSVRSASIQSTFVPSLVESVSPRVASRAGSLETRMRSWPRFEKRSAYAAPMPAGAPVIMTVGSLSMRNLQWMCSGLAGQGASIPNDDGATAANIGPDCRKGGIMGDPAILVIR